MDEETRMKLEYEEQFYGMSSRFFIDSFKNFLMNELYSKIDLLVNNFKNKIISQAENVEKFELGLKEMRESLLARYSRSLDETFQKDQKEISNILSIPKNVLLKEDLVLSNGVNKDIDNINKEINNLKETYQSLLYLKHVLMEELVQADWAIMFMESFITEDKVKMNILEAEKICELSKQNRILLESNCSKV